MWKMRVGRVDKLMMAAVLALAGTLAGSAPAAAGDGEPPPTLAEVISYMLIDGLVEIGDVSRIPLVAENGVVSNDPNPIGATAAGWVRFDGSAAGAETFALEEFGESVRWLNRGDPGYFANQGAYTAVVACLRTSPELTDDQISEVSAAFLLAGQEALVDSPFGASDPNLGKNSVASLARVGDETRAGFSFVSAGAFAQGANPIPMFDFWRDGNYYVAWIVPGIPEQLDVTTFQSDQLSLEGGSYQKESVTPIVGAVTATMTAGVDVAAVAAQIQADPPAGAVPKSPVDDSAVPVETGSETEVPDEGEPVVDPPPDDGSEPAPAGDADQPVAIAPPEPATESTATTSTEPPPPASADDSNGGSSAGLLVLLLLIAIIAPLLFLFVWYLPRRKRAAAADHPTGGDEPAPTGGSEDTGTPSSPTPEHQGGATTNPPVVPGAPPPHVQCDWELRLGTRVLKKAAPGHLACCVYQLDIETNASIPERGVFLADDQDDRHRVPVLRSVGAGLGFEAGATTRSEPDDDSVRDAVVDDALGMAADSVALATPDGLPPDVAVHLACGETTEVTVTLESKCRDHDHQYQGTVDSHIELSAGGICTNGDPGDRCDVWLGAAGAGDADVSGDVDLNVATDADLGALALQGERQSHDHDQPDGTATPVVSGADNGTQGPIVKAGLAWSATFSNEFTLDAAQIIPTATRSTTDQVATSALGAITHALSLAASTIDRSCAGAGCGCGATDCTCEPSFKLDINAEKQELMVDNTPWTLYRDDASGPSWKAAR